MPSANSQASKNMCQADYALLSPSLQPEPYVTPIFVITPENSITASFLVVTFPETSATC